MLCVQYNNVGQKFYNHELKLSEIYKTEAWLQHSTNASYIRTTYYQNGEEHREDGPAIVSEQEHQCWDRINKVWIYWIAQHEIWRKNGKLSRDNNLPAEIIKSKNCNRMMVNWYVNGELHRTNGPCMVELYYENNKLTLDWFNYYINGKSFKKFFYPKNLLNIQHLIRSLLISRKTNKIYAPDKIAGVFTKRQILKLFS
jgi:hypothetical protein